MFAHADPRVRPGSLIAWIVIAGTVALVASPVAVLAWSLADPSTEVWAELWRTRLPSMIVETVVLVAAVVAGSVALGASLAWLVAAHDFAGRRAIGWLLVAPLAIPGYVGGFVWLDALSDVVGARGVRSLWLCALVLVLSLYPYVYLFARAAFADQGADTVAAARSLGAGPLGVFLRVALPAARPAIAAGAALVAMEVLTDIGTVRLFNVSTLADGVMRTWFGTGDAGAASELATALTGAALLLVAADRLLRRGARRSRGASEATMPRRRLSPAESAVALAVSLGVLTVALGVPLARLVGWSAETIRAGRAVTVSGGIAHHVASTVVLAGSAAVVCMASGALLALAVARRGRIAHALGRVSTVGYAMPGPVVAVGAVVALAAVDRRGWLPDGYFLVGSAAGLVFALVVRFFAVSYQGVEASLEKVAPTMLESARVLGAGRVRTAVAIELPSARYGVLAAAALLSVDLVKELPITLLLRPFGIDTLSTWVWQATSESLWAQAAVPSLVMVATGMVAVGVLLVALERGAEVVS
ncbi:MAG: ABC transporter permease subunit [Acidobacteria bacterium]|nr:ABC transporter permease subunit [Acidobacteriota bacterium]